MASNTLRLVGLDELDEGDVLHWLKAGLARDLAAMCVPKSDAERLELLHYARRRLIVGIGKLSIAIGSHPDAILPLDAVSVLAECADRYYDEDGDPLWGKLPDWAAS